MPEWPRQKGGRGIAVGHGDERERARDREGKLRGKDGKVFFCTTHTHTYSRI